MNNPAVVAELVYAYASEAYAARLESSNLSHGTSEFNEPGVAVEVTQLFALRRDLKDVSLLSKAKSKHTWRCNGQISPTAQVNLMNEIAVRATQLFALRRDLKDVSLLSKAKSKHTWRCNSQISPTALRLDFLDFLLYSFSQKSWFFDSLIFNLDIPF